MCNSGGCWGERDKQHEACQFGHTRHALQVTSLFPPPISLQRLPLVTSRPHKIRKVSSLMVDSPNTASLRRGASRQLPQHRLSQHHHQTLTRRAQDSPSAVSPIPHCVLQSSTRLLRWLLTLSLVHSPNGKTQHHSGRYKTLPNSWSGSTGSQLAGLISLFVGCLQVRPSLPRSFTTGDNVLVITTLIFLKTSYPQLDG